VRKFAATKKRSRESGYGLVFAAIGLIVFLGAAGLSVDMGYLRYQRRLLQTAADSAALAGAAQLGAGAGTGQATIAARADSQLNGFPNGGNIVVTPTPNVGTNTMVVKVQASYPTFFMRIFGGSFQNAIVSTTATAQYVGSRGCIYALTGGNGINVTGTVTAKNCNVISSQNITGSGSITAAAVGAHGTSIGTTPPAIPNIQHTSDPLSQSAAMADPGTACGPANTINYKAAQNVLGPKTLTPGKYCGISFSAGYSQPVTFVAGNYYITGGLSIQNSGNVNGTGGVFFYVRSGAVSFSNSQRIRLTAPNNGTHAGILFFQPTANNNTATINGSNGGGGSWMQGALYFPNAQLNMNGAGNNANSQYLLLVAHTLHLNTNITTTSNYASLPNATSPIRTSVLVE
jgi:Flp pilus assembly protein TadG